jgi:hypothetical protein
MLAHAAPQHRCRHVVIAAFLLRLLKNVKNDPLLAGQAVADIG